jgi:hypothetical protein
MKPVLLVFICAVSFKISAQNFKQQIARILPGTYALPYFGFQITPEGYFNASSKYTNYIVEERKSDSAEWQTIDSAVCFYNRQKRLIGTLHYKLDDGAWKASQKTEIFSDEAGYPKYKMDSIWNNATQRWKCTSITNYLIDTAAGIFTQETYYSKHSDSVTWTWVHSAKEIHLYDVRGDDSISIRQEWNKQDSDWINSHRETKTYDIEEHITGTLAEEWNKQDKVWRNSWLKIFVYDTAGNQVFESYDRAVNDGWGNYSIDSTFYDNLNRETVSKGYRWLKPKTGIWKFTGRWELGDYSIRSYTGKNSKDYTALNWNLDNQADTMVLKDKEMQAFDARGNRINRYLINPRRQRNDIESHDSAVFDNNNNIIYFYREQNFSSTKNSAFFTTFFYPVADAPAIKPEEKRLMKREH